MACIIIVLKRYSAIQIIILPQSVLTRLIPSKKVAEITESVIITFAMLLPEYAA